MSFTFKRIHSGSTASGKMAERKSSNTRTVPRLKIDRASDWVTRTRDRERPKHEILVHYR